MVHLPSNEYHRLIGFQLADRNRPEIQEGKPIPLRYLIRENEINGRFALVRRYKGVVYTRIIDQAERELFRGDPSYRSLLDIDIAFQNTPILPLWETVCRLPSRSVCITMWHSLDHVIKVLLPSP